MGFSETQELNEDGGDAQDCRSYSVGVVSDGSHQDLE